MERRADPRQKSVILHIVNNHDIPSKPRVRIVVASSTAAAVSKEASLFRLMSRSAIAMVIAMVPNFATAQPRDGAGPPATARSASDFSARDEQPAAPPATSPLAVHVGDADFLIGGFMDLTSITRSTATGNGISTNFSNFPFSTTATGAPNPNANLGETRFSAQNSRISLQATSKVGTASLKGYVEVDFLGNTAQNLNVTSNSNGLRMRLYWVQYQQGKFEFLAGQSWSFLVPNRNGLSPMPGDLFYSQDVDTNYQMGLTWQRVPGVRFIAHATDAVAVGVALENPEQYVGGAVVLPKAFPAFEVDTGAGSSLVGSASATPNLYPDITAKLALDPKTGSTHQHIDVAVLVRGFKTYNPTTNASSSTTGSGESVNAVIEPVRGLRLIATNFFSKGGGRMIGNTGTPDFIVNPDFSMSLVKSWSGIYGAEVTAKNTLLYGYYSVDRIDQNATLDADGKTPIGYGITGSQAANHKIDEVTVGLTQTFFRDPKIGGMQLMIQYSNLKRTPFSVPAGTPADAKLNMFYVNVRYLLP
jgi:hypothetical protein